ncbi:hypothetical protein AMATHDRAFT_86302 [Amanita thiersii Skay4041]|uniref:Uncharacterized protein n=1 Tax=Amanita thiersii Skay4041 TaxID=703135 RepID=A0A2A9NG82_9AGAR|nr:hypothetical protein AMATHDRAFT_86302 [Amanita thiersii Skay4041]
MRLSYILVLVVSLASLVVSKPMHNGLSNNYNLSIQLHRRTYPFHRGNAGHNPIGLHSKRSAETNRLIPQSMETMARIREDKCRFLVTDKEITPSECRNKGGIGILMDRGDISAACVDISETNVNHLRQLMTPYLCFTDKPPKESQLIVRASTKTPIMTGKYFIYLNFKHLAFTPEKPERKCTAALFDEIMEADLIDQLKRSKRWIEPKGQTSR